MILADQITSLRSDLPIYSDTATEKQQGTGAVLLGFFLTLCLKCKFKKRSCSSKNKFGLFKLWMKTKNM